ncbi:ABC transporter substrate-binding protein [Streptomyces sp. NPDC058067]|uniref:ABC transporter substrate-binding protein n=1 Tax=Streptomyces sp. NPDC058067 TaxID=3346324 RepID=UPI0036ECC091
MHAIRRTTARTALAAAIATVMLTAGCGQKIDGDKKTGQVGGKGADIGAAAKSEKQVDYWSTWGESEPQAKIFKARATAFTKATGIAVNIKYLGRSGNKVLPQAITSGNGPDLFDGGSDHIAADEAQHLTQSVDGVLKLPVPGESGKSVSDVLPANVLKSAQDKDGRLIVVPHTLISTAIWYDAARTPGIAKNKPKTWSDFLALLDREKAAGRTPIAQDGLVNSYNVYWFYWLMMRHGGPGSLVGLSTDAKSWDSPAVLKAAKDVARLAKGGYFQSGYMGTKYPAAQNDWAQGKGALNINGTWLAAETKPQAPADAAPDSFSFPTVPGGHDSVEIGSLGWELSAKAKHPNAAKLFLSYLVQKAVSEQISRTALNIPARQDTPAPVALKSAQAAMVSAKETNTTYDGATANSAWWNNVLLPLDDKLLGGKISPSAFVAEGRKKTADALANG